MSGVHKTPPWSIAVRNEAMQYWAHSSVDDHKECIPSFLHDKLANMVKVSQWLVFPYSTVQHANHL